MNTRISKGVESPVTATALALESRQGNEVLDQAILVSCDLVVIGDGILEPVRQRLKTRIPGFDASKLILNATHTHTAPDLFDGQYEIPREGVLQPAEYRAFLIDRITLIAASAWENRRPGQVGWGLGHAVVAQNRRAVYADGHAQMYGRTDQPEFRRIEGYEDHGVEVLFFWDRDKRLMATAINVACPSQEVEGRSAVNADFWHEVREQLRDRHGKDLLVLAWTGAGGDQSPHLLYRERPRSECASLRKLTRLQELARRIVAAWEEAYEGARQEMHADVPLVHKVQSITLPARKVTEQEWKEARAQVEALSKDPRNRRSRLWYQEVVDRFEQQKSDSNANFHDGASCPPAGGRGHRDESVRAVHRLRDPDQGPQPCTSDLPDPARRPGGNLRPHRAGRARGRLQRDRGKQPRRLRRGTGAGGANRGSDQCPVAFPLNLFHELLQHPERHRPERQQPVVEGTEVEGGTGASAGLLPDLPDLQLADLVGQGLAGPGDVAVDLVLDLVAGERRVLLHVLDGLGPAPALVVHAGVNHQAGTAQGVVIEPAEDGVRVGVQADLPGQ